VDRGFRAFAHLGDQLAQTAKVFVERRLCMCACGRHAVLLLSHTGL
jgi:hypothetical protein